MVGEACRSTAARAAAAPLPSLLLPPPPLLPPRRLASIAAASVGALLDITLRREWASEHLTSAQGLQKVVNAHALSHRLQSLQEYAEMKEEQSKAAARVKERIGGRRRND